MHSIRRQIAISLITASVLTLYVMALRDTQFTSFLGAPIYTLLVPLSLFNISSLGLAAYYSIFWIGYSLFTFFVIKLITSKDLLSIQIAISFVIGLVVTPLIWSFPNPLWFVLVPTYALFGDSFGNNPMLTTMWITYSLIVFLVIKLFYIIKKSLTKIQKRHL